MQALDLMSLHFEVYEYYRPSLVLAHLALVHMQEMGLLRFYPNMDRAQLRRGIEGWALNQADGPDDTFIVFKMFLENYCREMLPENFNAQDWASGLVHELCFACQFYTAIPLFFEPMCRPKRFEEQRVAPDGRIYPVTAFKLEWETLESYAAAHQHTDQKEAFPFCSKSSSDSDECKFLLMLLKESPSMGVVAPVSTKSAPEGLV